ncbi:DNA-binding PadR family transcriptional regulator [Thermosporothrix hazakensis]|uniref:DNA-binding PadR family transcriptional regulator n=2 Tax=Thermosporothrix TaxID=768650 RepID=A0A326UC32_THEHA|nr:PadR family transcriptional regulator [Thermosporothrix hazakensis]PZW36057.1 DNA-binding PadR family transcriptional regulator [Thermosporothrix hazakensis]BBH88523.1 hypothetical protein KTC_32740 [Thermosporothrix sp. COM3]GCE46708.1 hypothetical protein KTH_15770 [Thermosporothrix hazakensis]
MRGRFGRQFAESFFGPDFEHCGPHHHHERRQMWKQMKRNLVMARYFGREDISSTVLTLLRERPMTGYELLKLLEEKQFGFAAPGVDVVYPTLQMLEDQGYVTATVADGKKVYSITDAGKAHLEAQSSHQENPWEQWRERFHTYRDRWASPEVQALRVEASEVARLFAIASWEAIEKPERLAQVREILGRTRRDLTSLIYPEETPEPKSESNTES